MSHCLSHDTHTPATSGSLADSVETRILEMIRKLEIAAGSSLPHELELAERFGVSRGVVREALTRLQSLGIVDRRKRRGTVLAEPHLFSQLGRYMLPSIFSEGSARQLFELRLVIELGSAELVCAHITAQTLDQLQAIVQREQHADSLDALIECDVQFHSTLYQAAGNASLASFQSLLEPFFRQAIVDEQVSEPRTGSVDHAQLLEVLGTRDPDRFRATLREHLEPHWRRYTGPPPA